MRTLGIVLIIIGIIMFIIRGFNWTEKEEVLDVGAVEINKEEQHSVTWPYYAGGIAVIAGIVMVISDRRARTT